jgi:hypothetical protein
MDLYNANYINEGYLNNITIDKDNIKALSPECSRNPDTHYFTLPSYKKCSMQAFLGFM